MKNDLQNLLKDIKQLYVFIFGKWYKNLWQDAAYNCKSLNKYVREWTVQTIKRSRSRFRLIEEQFLVEVEKPKFEVLPRRWVIERTFSWFSRYRRQRL